MHTGEVLRCFEYMLWGSVDWFVDNPPDPPPICRYRVINGLLQRLRSIHLGRHKAAERLVFCAVTASCSSIARRVKGQRP